MHIQLVEFLVFPGVFQCGCQDGKRILLSSEQSLAWRGEGRKGGRDCNILINIQNWNSLRVRSISSFTELLFPALTYI